jgi:hypothetical protein
MKPVLTTNSIIKCPHGGTAHLTTTNTVFSIQGSAALLETDVHTIHNCSPGASIAPCVKITWSNGATKLSVGGTPVLLETSTGRCYNHLNQFRGNAVITQTQTKVKAR